MTAALKRIKCGVAVMLDPLWDLDKFQSQCYKYSGCNNFYHYKACLDPLSNLDKFFNDSGLKTNQMWGSCYVRPAVRLRQILTSFVWDL